MIDDPKTWFITGAARGIGLQIAQAALEQGDRIVATARNLEALERSLPADDNVLHVALDVTRPDQSQTAASDAVARFGRIDVLVNNAGYGQLGVFEEIAHPSIAKQFDTNVFGLMHVTASGSTDNAGTEIGTDL